MQCSITILTAMENQRQLAPVNTIEDIPIYYFGLCVELYRNYLQEKNSPIVSYHDLREKNFSDLDAQLIAALNYKSGRSPIDCAIDLENFDIDKKMSNYRELISQIRKSWILTHGEKKCWWVENPIAYKSERIRDILHGSLLTLIVEKFNMRKICAIEWEFPAILYEHAYKSTLKDIKCFINVDSIEQVRSILKLDFQDKK